MHAVLPLIERVPVAASGHRWWTCGACRAADAAGGAAANGRLRRAHVQAGRTRAAVASARHATSWCCWCRPAIRWPAAAQITMEEMGRQSVIAHNDPSPARDRVLRLYEQRHAPLNIRMSLPSLDGIKRAVEMGLGVALLPRRCAQGEIARGQLIAVRVPELRAPRGDAVRVSQGCRHCRTPRGRSWRSRRVTDVALKSESRCTPPVVSQRRGYSEPAMYGSRAAVASTSLVVVEQQAGGVPGAARAGLARGVRQRAPDA